MKPLTLEWIEKAEEDWVVMLRSYRARKDPSYNAACFHAQQCAEKYLKGRLEEAGIAFRKTHDLSELLNQATAIEPGWATLQPEITSLNRFSVTFRYPGQSATKQGPNRLYKIAAKSARPPAPPLVCPFDRIDITFRYYQQELLKMGK